MNMRVMRVRNLKEYRIMFGEGRVNLLPKQEKDVTIFNNIKEFKKSENQHKASCMEEHLDKAINNGMVAVVEAETTEAPAVELELEKAEATEAPAVELELEKAEATEAPAVEVGPEKAETTEAPAVEVEPEKAEATEAPAVEVEPEKAKATVVKSEVKRSGKRTKSENLED